MAMLTNTRAARPNASRTARTAPLVLVLSGGGGAVDVSALETRARRTGRHDDATAVNVAACAEDCNAGAATADAHDEKSPQRYHASIESPASHTTCT